MKPFPRDLFPLLQNALNDSRVVVLTGMRQVGKTTTLRWLLDSISSDNKVFLDLERLDVRAVFQEQNYEAVLRYFHGLGLQTDQPLTVAVDEIQYAPNLPSVVKYLHDHYRVKFILSGSSSFYLKNYFSESLAGRKILFEMFPLNFGEFLTFRGIPHSRTESFRDMLFDSHEYERLKGVYTEYLQFGGLPGVVLEPEHRVKLELLNDILSSYINIDVQAMADFRKISELQQLLELLAVRIGSKLDLSQLSRVLGVSRPTLNSYLDFLEKTYVINLLPAFAGPDRAAALGKKAYFRDNGIARILAHPGDGALFENAVHNQLQPYGNLSYLSRSNQYEIDFVLSTPGAAPAGFEIKLHPIGKEKLKLEERAQTHGLGEAWLIGRDPTPGFDAFIWGGAVY